MHVGCLKRVWGGFGCRGINRFMEDRMDLGDELVDEEGAEALAWLGKHSQADAGGAYAMVAAGVTLMQDCIDGKERPIDIEVARHGTEGCEDTIRDVIREFEQVHNVEVLHAAECGSRMFGWGSQDSDFDIKLVYKHPLERYISIKARDLPSRLSYVCWGNLTTATPLDITIIGWDVHQFLELVQDSNPTAIECLYSPVVWKGTPFAQLREVLPPHVSLLKYIQSRMSIVQATALRHLELQLNPKRAKKSKSKGTERQPPTHIKPKEYIIMLRSVVEIAIVLEGKTPFPPPMEIHQLWALYTATHEVPADITEWVTSFLETKNSLSKYHPSNMLVERSVPVEDFIFTKYKDLFADLGDCDGADDAENSLKSSLFRKPLPHKYLNTLLRSIVMGTDP
eukprot:TRINITY_DN313_c1_g1_i1.p1 TRINITY_DN313_c1_g1~~TRINITY_DN313_c1_g1_i1.p1  ORF type:complete len:396 (+),score=126.88 TRINITY_DN313_c1_g1_i1:580-1767(+)